MMGVAFVSTVFLIGLEGVKTVVEVDVRRGMPSFKVVGLPSSVVEESRERVLSAVKNIGVDIGARKVVINLSPAEVPKKGSHADLPIAIALLKAMNVIQDDFSGALILGELSLNGRVRMSSSMFALIAQGISLGYKQFIIPDEASYLINVFSNVAYIPVSNLSEFLSGNLSWQQTEGFIRVKTQNIVKDFGDIKGQYMAKYGAMLAAAGIHNMVMVGSPGVGKTMIAERMTGILPSMTEDEIIEVTKIYSATLGKETLVTDRPFRSPHSNTSVSAMFGGGRYVQPGEATLAHRGVLFVDEFPEFRRDVLEGLRTVVETRQVFLSKADIKVNFPADFLLVMASNPCPCGYLGHPHKQCRCSVSDIKRYQRKFSGPLMQRIDIQMWMTPPENMTRDELTTEYMREKVIIARNMQMKRYKGRYFNGTAPDNVFLQHVNMSTGASSAIEDIRIMGKDSGRELSKIKRLARTIADINEEDYVSEEHIWMALSFRKAMDMLVRFW
ncbi:YifB family Mg chelatase-like AAA ATPase [bacterium 3DAC]|nr:YifB family Mg chelatase-like AAA ATPase [bacterium 3DAC]